MDTRPGGKYRSSSRSRWKPVSQSTSPTRRAPSRAHRRSRDGAWSGPSTPAAPARPCGRPDELDRDGDFHGIARFIGTWSDAQESGLIRDDVDPRDVARLTLATMLGWLQFHEYIASSTRVEDGDSLDEIAAALTKLLVRPSKGR